MSEFRLSFPACAIAGKNRLTAEDITILRRFSFPDGIRNTNDAVTLMAIHTSCPQKCAEWHDFFIGSMTRFIVDVAFPHGSMDVINARWLHGMLSKGGVIGSQTELDLLLNVIAVSQHSPDCLAVLALEQLVFALRGIDCAYAQTRKSVAKSLDDSDLVFLRQALRGVLDRQDAFSNDIADVLKRIERLSPRHAEWAALLAKLDQTSADTATPSEDTEAKRWLRINDSFFAETAVA